MELRDHSRMLVAFAGVNPVAKAARVPIIQVTRATHSGKPSLYARQALSRLTLQELEWTQNVHSKGATLRLRGLYALGCSVPYLVELLGTQDRRVRSLLGGERESVRAALHHRIKELFDRDLWELEGPAADNARNRAREKGWLTPIELEEDLIDMPEPWAGRELDLRAAEMSYAEKIRCKNAYKEGDRAQLIVAGHQAYKLEYRQRRAAREAA